jgi:hypothetical protein
MRQRGRHTFWCVMEENEEEVSNLTTSLTKIKCYEKMCLKINNILNSIKI